MGWNKIEICNDIPLLNGLDKESRFYFVHSYYCASKNNEEVIAETNYGKLFNSVVNKDNIYGMQFHPEKSHKYGKIIFQNIKKIITKNAE
jgi:glutamine amidotransferase